MGGCLTDRGGWVAEQTEDQRNGRFVYGEVDVHPFYVSRDKLNGISIHIRKLTAVTSKRFDTQCDDLLQTGLLG